MRGKLPDQVVAALLKGLIPAHAGKTYTPLYDPNSTEAHPRACGENRIGVTQPAVAEGSSPRMRGKRLVATVCDYRLRLIPAHAGKTFYDIQPGDVLWAHPRACGENQSRT